jgi:glycosyltransferase involved in cell wall biosynthesis
VKASVPGARLVLVGDGPMRAQLEQQHPDVIFAGQRTGEDLAAHYASADLFVFPSLSETWGNVVTEAMASGLPVIAWNRAAAAELLRTGENGALLECGDLTGFRDAVLRLAQDPLALRRMGASARASALDVGWDGIVAAVEDRMRASLSGPQRLQAEAPESGMAPA